MNITVLQFHSKAKKLPKTHVLPEDACRRLSNFSEDSVEYEGHVYPSVEHAYQAQKYMCSNHPEYACKFYDGTVVSSIDARKMGSKSGMKAVETTLDIAKWTEVNEQVMEALISSKMERSEYIRQILTLSAEHGIRYVHFSRNDMFWGAHFDMETYEVTDGENRLGEMYNKKIQKMLA